MRIVQFTNNLNHFYFLLNIYLENICFYAYY